MNILRNLTRLGVAVLAVAATSIGFAQQKSNPSKSSASRLSRQAKPTTSRHAARFARPSLEHMRGAIATANLSHPEDVARERRNMPYTWAKNDCSHTMQVILNRIMGPFVSNVKYHISIDQPKAYYNQLKPYCDVNFMKFSTLSELRKATQISGLPDYAVIAYRKPSANPRQRRHVLAIMKDKHGRNIIIENGSGTYSKVIPNIDEHIRNRLAKSKAYSIRILDFTKAMHLVKEVKQEVRARKTKTSPEVLTTIIEAPPAIQENANTPVEIKIAPPPAKSYPVISNDEFDKIANKMTAKQQAEEVKLKRRISPKSIGAAIKGKLTKPAIKAIVPAQSGTPAPSQKYKDYNPQSIIGRLNAL